MSYQVTRVIFNENISSEKFGHTNIEAVPEMLWIEQPCNDGDDPDIIALNKDEAIQLIATITRALEVMRF
ncbi:hypothetical protein KNT87_gp179 [Erwinia phage Cronus]|uniref:Uncharacterized protein n=1 Tax=Erwinia phage Cronus TaxID=2163633 RepID=A0A2S1GLY1_9CAUD|nr:hypothetical protein KNT87_gp179 [Erwinia phage Cronus]AWD90390.1 hypothetical protein [Erwinia phage Cronus]